MRVTSELWASALVRRVFGTGGFAAVVRRGAAEAGALFVLVRGRDMLTLYGPAPQTGYGADRPAERAFVALPPTDEEAVAARLAREQRFDSDLWVIEIEPGRDGVGDLFPVLAD